MIDLLDERAELAIRVGPLKPSQLVAKKLGDAKPHGHWSPRPATWPCRRGTPQRPDDLAAHDLITFNFVARSRRMAGPGS
ncbi:hypothetical protein ACRAWD_24225 [Caulobacter segnis]